jgi:PAS domain S-box-containing protein
MVFEVQSPGSLRGWRGSLREVNPAGFVWAAGAGLLYFLAARLAIPLSTPEGVAQFWPPAGIAVGALIVLGRSARLPIAAAVAAASLAANGLGGRSASACIAFAIANSGEALLIAALVDRWFARPFELDQLKNVFGLFGAAAVGTAIWEAVSALFLRLAHYTTAPFPQVWGGLVWANITCIVLVAPLLLGLAAAVRNPPSRRELLEGLAVLLLHALASAHAFALLPLGLGHWMLLAPFTSQLPLLLWLAVRCGPLFAAAGSLVLGLSILGSFEIERGRFADAAFPFTERLLAADFAMLATAFVALAIAALIAERKDAERRRGERLRFVTERARVGHWHWEIEPDRHEWSPLCKQLMGVAPGGKPISYTRFLAAVHPEDRERTDLAVRACLEWDGERAYDIEHRTLWPNGTVRWIHAKGSAIFDGNRPVRMAGIALDITDRKRAEELLRESEERLSAIVRTAVDAIIVIGEEGQIQSVNPATERLFGYAAGEFAGRNVSMLMPEPDRSLHDAYLAAYRRTGVGKLIGIGREVQARRKDGSLFPADLAVTEWRAGGKRFFTGIVRDITERKQREEQVQLLLREVNHRSKNMLTLVQAVARQTVASNPNDFLDRFGERVQAMAASQDLLVKSGWKGVALAELVRSQLAHFKDLIGSRIELAGPPLAISAPAAQAIGMAVHELATNAGKYGALANASGLISVAWSVESRCGQEPVFTMIWRERGGPPVKAPARQGFGTAVMCEMTEMSLSAEVGLDFEATGLTWRLGCAAEEVLEESQSARASRSAAAPPASVSAPARCGPAILVVEDEPLVAMEITRVLKRAGFEIVGPARTVGQGLELLRAKGCDAAVLDINLGKETSELVALELKERGTPFVTLSGYTLAQHPPAFHGAPALAKPLRPEVLVTEIQRCIEQEGPRPAI